MAEREDAPDIRILWHKTPVARQVHFCNLCGEAIAIGCRYENAGVIEDGKFIQYKAHARISPEISGCPKETARDEALARRQFEADKERYFPAPDDEDKNHG